MSGKPTMRMIKVDPELHAQIAEMAEELGIYPGELVSEAVTFYLTSTKEELLNRIQQRLDAMFEKLDNSTTYTVLPPQMAAERG